MTVRELIQALTECSMDADVIIKTDSRDIEIESADQPYAFGVKRAYLQLSQSVIAVDDIPEQEAV